MALTTGSDEASVARRGSPRALALSSNLWSHRNWALLFFVCWSDPNLMTREKGRRCSMWVCQSCSRLSSLRMSPTQIFSFAFKSLVLSAVSLTLALSTQSFSCKCYFALVRTGDIRPSVLDCCSPLVAQWWPGRIETTTLRGNKKVRQSAQRA